MTNVTTNKSTKSRQLYWDITFAGWILFLLFRIPITNIIGNEGNGLRDEVSASADVWVQIPMQVKVESLNAAIAASILMFEVYRQRR